VAYPSRRTASNRTAEIAHGIPVEHVRWFYRQARRINEPTLRGGLLLSGATDEEAARFAKALMTRIDALGAVNAAGGRADEGRRTIQTA
jgi:hypothetical protein